MSANAPKIAQQALEFNEAPLVFARNAEKSLSDESSYQPPTENNRSIRVITASSSHKASSFKKVGASEASASNQLTDGEKLQLDEELRKDIAQLLKLTANTLDAHSVFLLLPSLHLGSEMFGSFPSFRTCEEVAAGNSISRGNSQPQGLTPFASQTLSPKALPKKQTPIHAGPLLWVAKTGKPLHISPFEMEATGLGVYGTAIPLKSLAAVPIACERISEKMQHSCEQDAATSHNSLLKRGVLLVDSLKAYKFTPLQVKLLQQLGAQIERILELHVDRFNLLRDRVALSTQHALSPQQEYRHEQFKASKGHAGSKIQADPKKFRSQIEVLLREDNVKTLSVASISLTVPTLSVPSLSVPSFPAPKSQESVMAKQATGTLETSSSAQKESRRLLTSHFPVQRLLTLPQQIQEIWENSIRDFHAFLNSEMSAPGAESSELLSIPSGSIPSGSMPSGSMPSGSVPSGSVPSGSVPSGSQVASLVTGQQIILVCDHLRVAMLTKKIRGLFLFHLRKKLQFAIEDPREAIFENITQELFSTETAPLKSLIDSNNTTEGKEYGCIGEWLQYALSEGTSLHAPIVQSSRQPLRKWSWLRSDFPNLWKENSKKSGNLKGVSKERGLFARSSLSLEGTPHLGKTSRANDNSIQTLRYQSSREQDQPLRQRRAS